MFVWVVISHAEQQRQDTYEVEAEAGCDYRVQMM